MKKLLFVATVDYHFSAFHLPFMKSLKEQGWQVDVAAAGELDLPFTDNKYNIPIQRSPFHNKNIKAYRQLKKIVREGNYSIIHSHTPVGGVLARLVGQKARKMGTKIIYTAHGFHFCKGVPLKNWLFYYPIEKTLSHFTDTLITINHEDYEFAKSNLKAKHVEHVHGVGINLDRFQPISEKSKQVRKKSLGFHPDDFLLFYAAEFNPNKNQAFLIQSMVRLKERYQNVKLVLAGDGPSFEACQNLAHKLGVKDSVTFLGLRHDIDELLPLCDVAVASSLREGLPVNIMEAMACALPVVAVENRGHKELVKNDKNGWIISKNDHEAFVEKISILYQYEQIRKTFGRNGRYMVRDQYSEDRVIDELNQIYGNQLGEEVRVNWAIP